MPTPTTTPPHPRRGQPREALPARSGLERHGVLAIVALAILGSAAVMLNQFTLDDVAIIQENARLQSVTAVLRALAEPYWPPPYHPDLYRPVTVLLLAIQRWAGGGTEVMVRAGSVALYALSCLTMLLLARRVMRPVPAIVAAALFAVHPVHAEAIALGVGQAELVVAACLFWSATLYIDWRRCGSRLTLRQWAVLSGLYIVAALSKEQGLLLPAFLLLAEFAALDATGDRDVRNNLLRGFGMLFVFACAILALRGAVLGNALAVMPAQVLAGLSPLERLYTMLGVVPEWTRLLLWPVHLRVDYSPGEFMPATMFAGKEWAGAVVIWAATAAASLHWRTNRAIAFGLGWAGTSLMAVSNVVAPTGVLIAERTLFSPSAGVMIALVAWLGQLAAPVLSAGQRAAILRVAAGVVVTLLGARLVLREMAFRDNDTLTMARSVDSPKSAAAMEALGMLLFARGLPFEGEAAYRRAIEYSPQQWATRLQFAKRLRSVGRNREAAEELSMSLREQPTPEAVAELTAAMIGAGEYVGARQLADRVIGSQGPQPVMTSLRRLADSALAAGAPAGSINVRIDASAQIR